MKRLLALLLALLAAGPAFGQAVVQTDNVRAELLADVAAVKPGEPFWVGLRQTIRPKWHTYWKNPGESGLPTEIKWTLPPGVKADPIVWPTPHRFDIGGVINYGFQDEAVLLVRITPPADLGAGPLKLAAEANWLVCEDVCIPEDGKFELALPVDGDRRAGAARHARDLRQGAPERAGGEPVARALRRRQVGRPDPDRRGQAA